MDNRRTRKLNIPITSKTNIYWFTNLKTSYKKCPDVDGFTGEIHHFQRRMRISYSQNLQKKEEEENTSQLILWGQNTKTRKRHHKGRWGEKELLINSP